MNSQNPSSGRALGIAGATLTLGALLLVYLLTFVPTLGSEGDP